MDAPSNESVTFEGVRTFYQNYGKGSISLIFIHGWACDKSLWSGQYSLYHRHRSLLIDLPGHGESDAPHTEYSLEFFARAIRAVLQQEEIGKGILIGHSLGGPVATTFLRLFPDLVSSIIYVDSFFQLPQHYMNQQQRKQLAQKLSNDQTFEMIIDSFSTTKKSTPFTRSRVKKVMMGTAKHVRVNTITTDSLPHAYKWNEVFEIPALLFVTKRYSELDPQWLHHVPRLQVFGLDDDSGHFFFMEEPLRINAKIEEFLVAHGLLED